MQHQIRFLKNMKLASKQAFAFSFILVIMVSVNIFSLYKMSSIKKDIDMVTINHMPGVVAISEINAQTANFRITQLQHAAAPTPNEKKIHEQTMNRIKKTIQKSQNSYEPLIINEEEQVLFDEIVEKWNTYLEIDKQFLEYSRSDFSEKAVQILNDEAKVIFDELTSELQALLKINKKQSFMSAQRAEKTFESTRLVMVILLVVAMLISILMTLILVRNIIQPIKQLESAVTKIARGDESILLPIKSRDEIGNLARSFNLMTKSIREAKAATQHENWFKTGQNELNIKMRGDQDIQSLAKNIIQYLAKYLEAQIGALYLYNEQESHLKMISGYAFTRRKSLNNTIKIGEGIVGQAAYEKQTITVSNIPSDYILISSSLGEMPPVNILVAPFLYEGKLIGIIELGATRHFSDIEIDFINTITENIAIGFYSAQSSNKIKYLLQESQKKSEELQVQQMELKASNEELEAQTKALKLSEAKLKDQQEELEAANEELKEKTGFLEKQKSEIAKKNRALELASKALERKAKELETTSKYKSDFMANMSHELRTPLNSLLILARDFAENKSKNLTKNQIEAAEIIYKSGNELLMLINEILDLSKIESGKMNISIESLRIHDIAKSIESDFKHLVREKNLYLNIKTDKNLPDSIRTDQQRFYQIIKNLMSNAIKFTQRGGITVHFHRPKPETTFQHKELETKKTIAITIQDTGIGIPHDKQKAIFEAFHQADSSTSRKYGGTGLGLSISREIVKLLGGEIHLQSKVSEGSSFSVYLPQHSGLQTIRNKTNRKQAENKTDNKPESKNIISEKKNIQQTVSNDKTKTGKLPNVSRIDNLILIVEDDESFAQLLLKHCENRNLKAMIASTGEDALKMTEKYNPKAIILDIKLPDISGWNVLQQLRSTKKYKHIPVHIMSVDDAESDALHKGAIGFLAKPATKTDIESTFIKLEEYIEKEVNKILIIEDDKNMRSALAHLLNKSGIEITQANNGRDAMHIMQNKQFDCVILDLGLPDISGIELLNQLNDKNISIPPVIIYTGRDLTIDEEDNLKQFVESIIVKGDKSEERLLDEIALFLHQITKNTRTEKQKITTKPYDKEAVLTGKKILLVDDDMRNVFALSKILKEHDMQALKAENGEKAMKILKEHHDTDLILMDIMMPVMDGYQTIKAIRNHPGLKKIPIIALTAKAMHEDKEKCMQAGANDYLTKPVDIDRLLSIMRVWLYK